MQVLRSVLAVAGLVFLRCQIALATCGACVQQDYCPSNIPDMGLACDCVSGTVSTCLGFCQSGNQAEWFDTSYGYASGAFCCITGRGTLIEGSSCTSTSQCCMGSCDTTSHLCCQDEGAPCYNNSDCCNDNYQVATCQSDGTCWVPVGENCSTNAQCSSGNCNHGFCDSNAAGGSCRYNGDCTGGVCQSGVCKIASGSYAEECSANTDCALTKSGAMVDCDPWDHMCCNYAPGSCSQSSDCCPGSYCDNGTCAYADWHGWCGSNSQCTSNLCNSSSVCYCENVGTTLGGNWWWQCCSGNTQYSGGVWSCANPNTLGQTCSGPGGVTCNGYQECDSSDGKCHLTALGSDYEPCTVSTQCQQKPNALTCTSTGYGGSLCCNETNGGCAADSDCCQGWSCSVNNVCLKVPGASCTYSNDCLFGYCNGVTCN